MDQNTSPMRRRSGIGLSVVGFNPYMDQFGDGDGEILEFLIY